MDMLVKIIPLELNLSLSASSASDPIIALFSANSSIVYFGIVDLITSNAATQEQKTQAIKIQTEKDRAAADKEIAITNAEKEAQVAIKRAEAEAEAIRIKAEAEAEANGKISASVTDELIRYNEVEKWNGSKATVITSGSVITDTNKDMRNDVKNENN